MRRYKTYINGEWFEGTSGIVLRSVDPSNNKELGEIVQNSNEDVEYAIESASRSFYKTREWRDLDVQQRSDKLLRQHRIIIAYKQKAPSPKAECVEKHSIFIARVH